MVSPSQKKVSLPPSPLPPPRRAGAAKRNAQQKPEKTPFLRLLPVLIAVAVLMLSFRVNDLRHGIFDGASVELTSQLRAQQEEKKAPAANGAGGAAKAEAPKTTAPAAVPPAGEAETPAATMGNWTPAEIELLQKLSERRDALIARGRELDQREALLKAGQSQIEKKIAEMKTLQTTIEGLLRQKTAEEEKKILSLVRIYENMKPKDAARIFEQLEMPILLEVVGRMKEQRVAPVLAEMDPARARTLTSELAQRHQLPVPKTAAGG